MTDKEIFETEIKCINRRANGKCNGGTDCCKCDLLMDEKDIISAYERAIANSDLINRQHAEIDRLERKNEILSINADTAFQDGLNEAQDLYAEQVKDEIKSEAIKEFAVRLKCGVQQETGVIRCSDIDNLVKEMVG